MKSIEDSRFYIIVFSKNYASSSWCLDELVKITECRKASEQTAYPVFYDVDPTEIRKQSGPVEEAFEKHENKEAAGGWSKALNEAGNLAGWESKKTANGELEMHDHIEEMGKNIVHRVNPDKPERHSRLWIREQIEEILANDSATQAATKCCYYFLAVEVTYDGDDICMDNGDDICMDNGGEQDGDKPDAEA
nr:Toll/interleukin-1 receptor (TIR) domain-containing protein [Tanacetum cinerariifolium]